MKIKSYAIIGGALFIATTTLVGLLYMAKSLNIKWDEDGEGTDYEGLLRDILLPLFNED